MFKTYTPPNIGYSIFGLAVFVAAIAGWIMNIFSIFNMMASDISAELIIRLVGVVVLPIGIIAGYF